MVLSRKGRERDLMGRRSGCPPGPSTSAGLSVGARRPAGKQRLGARPLPESRRRNSRGMRMTRSRPTDLPGTAGVLAGIVDDGAQPRPVIPEFPRPGSPLAPRPANPASANPQSRIRATRRRAALPGCPGTPGPLPSRKPARTASRKSRKCESRNPGSGRRAGAPPRPVIPELPDRPRPGRPPARTASRKSRKCESRNPGPRCRAGAAPPGYPGTPGAPPHPGHPPAPRPRTITTGFTTAGRAGRGAMGAGAIPETGRASTLRPAGAADRDGFPAMPGGNGHGAAASSTPAEGATAPGRR